MTRFKAVRTFVVFWLPGGMFINFVLLFFVDGKRKITVVDKHLKHRASKHNTRPEATSCKEYIVDVHIGHSKSVRSLYCSLSMFKKFRVGRTYDVYLKRNEIKSIAEPNKKQQELTRKMIDKVKTRSAALSISASMLMPNTDIDEEMVQAKERKES